MGPATDPDVRIGLTLNGSPWYTFDAKPGFFFIVMPVPAGALTASAPYVPLEVKSDAADDSGPGDRRRDSSSSICSRRACRW